MSRAPWRTSENRGFSSFSSQNSSDCFGALGSSVEPPHQQQSLPPVAARQGVSTNTQHFGGSAQYAGDGASYVTEHSGYMNKDAQSTAEQECASLALGASRFSKTDNQTLSHWSYNRFDASNVSRPGSASQPPSSFSSHIRTAENRSLPPTSAAYPAHGSVASQSPTTMYQLGAQDIRRYNSPFQQDTSQGATSQQLYPPSVTSSSSNAVQQLLKLLSEGTAGELPTRPVDSSDIQRLGNPMSSQPATHVLSGNTLQAENTFSRENHFVNSQIPPSRSAAAQVIELLSQLQERPSQQPLHRQQISYPVQSSLEPSPRPPSSRQQPMLEPSLSSLPSEYPRDHFSRGSGNHPDAGPDMAATARRLLASLQHLVPSASGGPPPQQGAPSKDRSFPGQSSFPCVTHAEQPSFSTYGVTRAESQHPYRTTTIEGRGINSNALLSSVLQSQSSSTQLQPSSFQTPPSFPSPHDQAQRQLALTSQIHSILSRLSKDTGSLSDLQTAVRPASSNVDVQPSTAAPLPQTTQTTSMSSTTPLSMHYRPPPPPASASADGPIGADPLASRNRFLGSEKQSSSAPPRWGRQWQRRQQGSDSPSPGRSAPLQMTSMYFSNGAAPPLARGPGVPPSAPLGRTSFLGPARSHQESRFHRGPTAALPGVSSAPQHRLDREKPRSKMSTDREGGPRKRGRSPSIHEAREEEGQERWAQSRDTRSRRWADHPGTVPCPSSGKPWPGSHVWRSKPSAYLMGWSKEEKAVRRDSPSPSRGFSLRREKHISVTPVSAPPPPSRPYIHRVRSPSLKTTTAHRPRSRPSPSVHRRRRPSSSSSCGFSTSKKPPRGASPIPFSGWDDSKPHRRPSLVQLNVHGPGFPSPGVSHRGPGRSRERGGGPRRLLSGAGSRGSPHYSHHPSGEASLERDGGRTRREPSSATAQARQKRPARHFSWGPSTATKRTHVTNHKLPLIEDAECQQELALSKKSVFQLIAEGEPLAAAKFVTELPSPRKCSLMDDPQTDQATTPTRIQNKMPSIWVHSSLHYLYDTWKYFHDALSAAGTPRIAERCPPCLLITGLPNVNASALQKALSNHFKALKIPLGKLVIPVYPETGFCLGYCLVEVGTHWPVIASLLRAPQFQWRGVCTQIRPLPCPLMFQLNAYLARGAAQRSKAQGALNVADWTPSQFDACSSVLYPPMMDALTQMMARRREQDSEDNQSFGLQASPFSVQSPIMAVTSTHRLKLLVPVSSCALSAQLSLWLQPQLLRSTTVPPLSETTSVEDISPSAYFPLYTAPQAAVATTLHHISNSSTTQETTFVLPENAASSAGVTQILPPPFLTQTNATNNVLPLISETTENAVGTSEKSTEETTESAALPSETLTLPSTPRCSALHQSAAHQSLSSNEPSVECSTDTNALTDTAADATPCCIQASENGVTEVVEKGEPLDSHLPPHVPISTKSDPLNSSSENYDRELHLQLQLQQQHHLIEVKDSGAATTDDLCKESGDSSQNAFTSSAFIDGDSTATVVADGDMDVSQSDDDDDDDGMTSSLTNVLQRKFSQDQLEAASSSHTDPCSALAQYWLSESSTAAEHPDSSSSSTLFSSLLPAKPLNVTGQVLPTLIPKRAPSTTVSLSRHSPSLEFPDFPSLKVDRENVVVKPVAREEEFGLLSLFQFVHNSLLGLHILLAFADKLALWSEQTQETLKTRPAADTVATWASPFDFETEGLYAHELREDLVALRPILKSLMPNKSLPLFEEAPHVIYLSQLPNRIIQQDQDGIARPLFESLLERLGADTSSKHALDSELWGPQYFRFAETSRYRGDGIVLLPSFCPVSRYGNPYPDDDTPPSEVARRYIIQLPGLYRPIRIHRALYLAQDVDRDMHIIAQVVKQWTTILAYHLIAFVAENNETRFLEAGNTGAPGSPMALAEIQAHSRLITLFESLPYLKCFASGIRLPIEDGLLDLRAWLSMLPTIHQLMDATKNASASVGPDPLELLALEGSIGRCSLANSSCSAVHFIETYFFSVESFFRLPSFAPCLKVFCHGASQQPCAEPTENIRLAPVMKRQIRITAHMQQKLQQEICRHTLPNFFLPVQHRALVAYHQAADVAGATEQLFSPITGELLDETSPITLSDVCCASSVVSKVLDILVRYVEANFPVTTSVSPTAESQKRMPQVVQWLMFENEPDWQATARIPSILCASGQPLAGMVGQGGNEGTSPFELTGDIYSSAAEAKLCCALSCLRYFAHLERTLLSTLGVSAKDDLETLTFVDATQEESTVSEQPPELYAVGLSSADEDIKEDVPSTRTTSRERIETTWDDNPRNIDESHYRESIPVASLSLSGGLEDIADVSASFESNLWTPEGLRQLQENAQFRFVPLRYTISTPRHQYLASRVVQKHVRGQEKQYKWTHHNNLFQPKEEDVIANELQQKGVEKAMLTQQVFKHTPVAHALPVDASPKPTADTKPDPLLSVT